MKYCQSLPYSIPLALSWSQHRHPCAIEGKAETWRASGRALYMTSREHFIFVKAELVVSSIADYWELNSPEPLGRLSSTPHSE